MLKIFSLFLIMSTLSFAQVHEYETTRLKGTAGAGVASALQQETVILNPAPLPFFNYSSLYYSRTTAKEIDEQKNTNYKDLNQDTKSTAIIATDTRNRSNGTLSYIKQTEGIDTRKRFSMAMASTAGQKSSFGFSYHYTIDSTLLNPEQKNKIHHVNLGVIHSASDNLTVGAIIIDPAKQLNDKNMLFLGLQYTLSNIITFIGDGGFDYNEDPSDSLAYKLAIQFKFFSDLYIRTGMFNDRKIQEKGNGIGLSWASPRLVFDAAYKTSKPLSSTTVNTIAYGTEVRETSMSLTYRF